MIVPRCARVWRWGWVRLEPHHRCHPPASVGLYSGPGADLPLSSVLCLCWPPHVSSWHLVTTVTRNAATMRPILSVLPLVTLIGCDLDKKAKDLSMFEGNYNNTLWRGHRKMMVLHKRKEFNWNISFQNFYKIYDQNNFPRKVWILMHFHKFCF